MLFNIELSAWGILIIWLTLRKKKQLIIWQTAKGILAYISSL